MSKSPVSSVALSIMLAISIAIKIGFEPFINLGKNISPTSATAPTTALIVLPFDNSSLKFNPAPAKPNPFAHFCALYFLPKNSSTLETSPFAFAFIYFCNKSFVLVSYDKV